jgi:hypothetical protein
MTGYCSAFIPQIQTNLSKKNYFSGSNSNLINLNFSLGIPGKFNLT